jgi:hypothetical protein
MLAVVPWIVSMEMSEMLRGGEAVTIDYNVMQYR